MSREQDDPHDDERPRGILSKTDRKWIKGLQTYKHRPTESKRKRVVHERIRNALYDFALLIHYPEKIDRDRLHADLAPPELNPDLGAEPLYEWAAMNAMAFLLIDDVKENSVDEFDSSEPGLRLPPLVEQLESRLEEVLNLAINHARDPDWRSHSRSSTEYRTRVDLAIETAVHDPFEAGRLQREIDEGGITREGLLGLVERDEVSAETAAAALGWSDNEAE